MKKFMSGNLIFGLVAILFLVLFTGCDQTTGTLGGAAIGTGAGAGIGRAVGGRDGAIIGGVMGGLAGGAVGSHVAGQEKRLEEERSSRAPAARGNYDNSFELEKQKIEIERQRIELEKERLKLEKQRKEFYQ
jgi:uncharacterized protein YcfJ